MELERCQTIASLFLVVLLAVPISVLAGTWSRKADIPTPRSQDNEVCIVDGMIYCVGGGGARHAVEAYDPGTDTWTRKANIPTPREEMGLSIVDGIVYACGGLTNEEPYQGENNGACSAMEAYDPGTDTWTRKAEMPMRRRGMKTEAVDGIIYAFGGEKATKNKDGAFAYEGGIEVFAYEPGTDTWTRKADMLDTRSWFGSCVLNGEIYAAGGWWMTNRAHIISVYNPRSDTWRTLSPPGAMQANPAGGQAAVALENKIYIMGGWGDTIGRVWIYDPYLDTLVRGPSMTVPIRAYFGAITLNGKIYAIGGWNAGGPVQVNARVDVYNPLAAPPVQQIRSVEVKDKLITEWGTLKIAE